LILLTWAHKNRLSDVSRKLAYLNCSTLPSRNISWIPKIQKHPAHINTGSLTDSAAPSHQVRIMSSSGRARGSKHSDGAVIPQCPEDDGCKLEWGDGKEQHLILQMQSNVMRHLY